MKKLLLKIRILLTNFSRVLISLLFINLNFSFANSVFGVSLNDYFGPQEVTCYDSGPDPIIPPNTFILKNVLIILVPIAIIIGIIILNVKKKKNKSNEEKKDVEKG